MYRAIDFPVSDRFRYFRLLLVSPSNERLMGKKVAASQMLEAGSCTLSLRLLEHHEHLSDHNWWTSKVGFRPPQNVINRNEAWANVGSGSGSVRWHSNLRPIVSWNIQAEIHHAELINPNFVNTCGTVAFLLQIKIMASSWIGNSSYEPGKCSVKSASTGNRAISANCKFLIHLPKTPFMQIFQTHPSLLGGVRFSAADTFPGMNRSYNGAWIETLTRQFYFVYFRRIASWWKMKRKLLFY